MTNLNLARAFRDAVLNITSKDGQPATLGTSGGTVFYNDGSDDHLDRVWVRMGAEHQIQVVAKVGKRGLPNVPGLEVNVSKRHGSLYVDDWQATSGIGGSSTTGIGVSGHTHDYETRNVRVSEYAGTPSGSDNVVVGHTAGDGMGASADQNVIIGSSAASTAAADADSVVIGYQAGDYAAAAGGIDSFDAAVDITVVGEDIATQQAQGETTPQRNAKLTSSRVVTVYGSDGGTANEKGYARIIDTSTSTVYSASKFTQIDHDFGQANVIALDTDAFLVAFEEYDNVTDTAFELWLIAGTESGGTISWGSAVQVTNYTPSQDFHLDKISASAAVLTVGDTGGTYTDAMIITISGTTVTVGTAYAYTTDNVASANSYVLSATKIVTVWNATSGADRTIKAKVANISGTAITYDSTAYTVAADSSDTPKYIRGGALDSTRFLASFLRVDGLNVEGKAIVGEVAGDDSISFGSEAEWFGDVFDLHALNVFSSTLAVVVYEDGVTGAWGFDAKILAISDTTITAGAAATFTPDDDDEYPHVVMLDASAFFVSYNTTDGGGDTYIRYTLGNLTSNARTGNVFIGSGAGGGDGVSYNVAIGYQAGANETNSNRLHIDKSNTATPLIYGEFDNDNLGINTTDMAGGAGVIAIANVTTAPASTPSGGGVLYVEGGALKYKGSSGTVTTLGVA